MHHVPCTGTLRGIQRGAGVRGAGEKEDEEQKGDILQCDKAEIMLKKQEGTLLGGMYELPKYDIDTSIETIEEELGLSLDHPDIHTGSVKHVFTHQVWYMEGYVLYTKGKHEDFVPRAEVAKLPMSKAMQKVYRQLEL